MRLRMLSCIIGLVLPLYGASQGMANLRQTATDERVVSAKKALDEMSRAGLLSKVSSLKMSNFAEYSRLLDLLETELAVIYKRPVSVDAVGDDLKVSIAGFDAPLAVTHAQADDFMANLRRNSGLTITTDKLQMLPVNTWVIAESGGLGLESKTNWTGGTYDGDLASIRHWGGPAKSVGWDEFGDGNDRIKILRALTFDLQKWRAPGEVPNISIGRGQFPGLGIAFPIKSGGSSTNPDPDAIDWARLNGSAKQKWQEHCFAQLERAVGNTPAGLGQAASVYPDVPSRSRTSAPMRSISDVQYERQFLISYDTKNSVASSTRFSVSAIRRKRTASRRTFADEPSYGYADQRQFEDAMRDLIYCEMKTLTLSSSEKQAREDLINRFLTERGCS